MDGPCASAAPSLPLRLRSISRTVPLTLVVILTAGLTGCGWFGVGSSETIAEISGERITRQEFDRYVEETLNDGAGAGSEAPTDELLSRLLDRYLDEELIVREARRSGIKVTEQEAGAEIRFLQHEEEPAPTADQEGQVLRNARRSVLLRKFREDQVLSGIQVSDQEIADYYDSHRSKFRQSTRLVLRQILLDDEEAARKLREELWKDPNGFEAAAAEHSLAPDGGRPAAYLTANLPPEIIEAVDAVGEGQVSRVSKSPEGARIFLVEKKEAAREVTQEEAAGRIRVILMQEKSRQATERLLATLRVEAGVVIRKENLGFSYSK